MDDERVFFDYLTHLFRGWDEEDRGRYDWGL